MDNESKVLVVVGVLIVVVALVVSYGCTVLRSQTGETALSPGQNDYWVATNGQTAKTSQVYDAGIENYPYNTISTNFQCQWYTDYAGIVEPITRGDAKDWHIQTSVDLKIDVVNMDNAYLTMRVYHASNLYPETLHWTIQDGADWSTQYMSVSLNGQTVLVYLDAGFQTVNLGPINSVSITPTWLGTPP